MPHNLHDFCNANPVSDCPNHDSIELTCYRVECRRRVALCSVLF
jgi:hypothetical protein